MNDMNKVEDKYKATIKWEIFKISGGDSYTEECYSSVFGETIEDCKYKAKEEIRKNSYRDYGDFGIVISKLSGKIKDIVEVKPKPTGTVMTDEELKDKTEEYMARYSPFYLAMRVVQYEEKEGQDKERIERLVEMVESMMFERNGSKK